MKTTVSLVLLSIGFLFSCQQQPPAVSSNSSVPVNSSDSTDSPVTRKGMIKVTILYPYSEGKHFDMHYYEHTHMPLVATLMGDSLKAVKIDKGIASGRPGEPLPFAAIGYLYFERLSAYENALAPYADTIRKDIAKYTDIIPVIQVSEVLQ